MSKKDKAAHEAEVVEPQAGGVPPDGESLAAEIGDGQETQSSEDVGGQSKAKAPEMPERAREEKKVVGVQSTVPARTHVPGVGLVDVSHPEK